MYGTEFVELLDIVGEYQIVQTKKVSYVLHFAEPNPR